MKRVSLSILFLAFLLLASMAFARIPHENKNENDQSLAFSWKPKIGWLKPVPKVEKGISRLCDQCNSQGKKCCVGKGQWCCSAKEYAEFVKAHSLPQN